MLEIERPYLLIGDLIFCGWGNFSIVVLGVTACFIVSLILPSKGK
ncbi:MULTISPECIES: hypothetical protein [Cytobacillus]|nr:hypothetical protein [Cytobacillus firmus]